MSQEYVRDLVKEIRDLIKKIEISTASAAPGDATAANQLAETALLTTIDADTSVLAALDKGTGLATANTLRVTLQAAQMAAIATETTSLAISSNTENTSILLTAFDRDAGASTSETLRVVLEDQTRDAIRFENWDKIVGNSKEFTWITGPGGGQVVSVIEYYTGASLIITQTFAYDLNDNVISITCT